MGAVIFETVPCASTRRRGWWIAVVVIAIIAVAAGILLALGRTQICRCGSVRLWHGVVWSAENSQHLTDWYTSSHIIHGFLFYALGGGVARWSGPAISWSARLIAATVAEAAWKIAENAPAVIDRYRAATIAVGSYGDSVVNSVSDMVAMLAGFALAGRLPVWAKVTAALVVEVATAIIIHDNLSLNVLMLLGPIGAVRAWQLGG